MPKGDENGELSGLHDEELHNLYCSSHIVREIKSRKLRWARPIAIMKEGRRGFKMLTGKSTEKETFRNAYA